MERKDICLDQQDTFHKLFLEMDFDRINESWNFLNLWMWWKPYNIQAIFSENVIACVLPKTDEVSREWFLRPICKKEYLSEFFDMATKTTGNDKVFIHNAHHELLDAFVERGFKVQIKEMTPILDEYFYEAEKLRTFAGKSLQKKRNLINNFKREFEGRWEYRKLTENDIPLVLEFLKEWKDSVEDKKDSTYFEEEYRITFDAIEAIGKLKFVKFGGIFVDGKLEGFSLSEMPSPDFININIEKANQSIVGLYQTLLSEFLKSEAPDAVYVSREDAGDDEGLKQSKLSYRPIKVVEKFDIIVSR